MGSFPEIMILLRAAIAYDTPSLHIALSPIRCSFLACSCQATAPPSERRWRAAPSRAPGRARPIRSATQSPRIRIVYNGARIWFLFQLWYHASFFRAIKVSIKANYLQAVLLSDRILIRVVKIQTEPFRDFWQSEKLLWV